MHAQIPSLRTFVLFPRCTIADTDDLLKETLLKARQHLAPARRRHPYADDSMKAALPHGCCEGRLLRPDEQGRALAH
jgi:hypothetical protein